MNGRYFRMIVRAVPPASVTMGGDPRNVKVISELTKHEIDAIDLVGLGVKIDHIAPDTYIGRVVETLPTPEGGLNLMLEIPPVRNRETVVGQFMDLIKQTLIRNIEKGNYSTVSLCHQPLRPESLKVDGDDIIVYPREIREVSITEDNNNYREGSDILAHYWSDESYLGTRFSSTDEYPKFMSHAAVRVRVDEWGNPPSDFDNDQSAQIPVSTKPQEDAYVEMLTRVYERMLTDEKQRELKNTANTPALIAGDDHRIPANQNNETPTEMSTIPDAKTNLTSSSTLPTPSASSVKPSANADDLNAMILKAEQLRKENEELKNKYKEIETIREKEAKERELLTAIKDRYQQEQQKKIEENKKFLEESVNKEFDTTLKNADLVDADSDETKAEKQVLETGKTEATSALQNIFKNLNERNPTCSDQDRELLSEMTRFFNTQNYALMAMNRKVHRAAKLAEESNQKKLEQIADSILAKRAAEAMNTSSSSAAAPAPDSFSIPQKRSGLDALSSSSSAAGTSSSSANKPRVDMEIIPFSNLMSKAMENVLEQRTIKKTRTESE